MKADFPALPEFIRFQGNFVRRFRSEVALPKVILLKMCFKSSIKEEIDLKSHG